MDICDQIVRARAAGITRCSVINGRFSLSEAALAFGLSDDPSTYRLIERSEADSIATSLLCTSLGYRKQLMIRQQADRYWAEFVEKFAGQNITFLTNGRWTDDSPSWTSATDATFDAGVLVLGENSIGCFWVEEED